MSDACVYCGSTANAALVLDLREICCPECAEDERHRRQHEAEKAIRRSRGEVFCEMCGSSGPIALSTTNSVIGPYCESCEAELDEAYGRYVRKSGEEYEWRHRAFGLDYGEALVSPETRITAGAWGRGEIRVLTIIGGYPAGQLVDVTATRRHKFGYPVRVIGAAREFSTPPEAYALVIPHLERPGPAQAAVLDHLARWIESRRPVLVASHDPLAAVARQAASTVPRLLEAHGEVIAAGEPEPELREFLEFLPPEVYE